MIENFNPRSPCEERLGHALTDALKRCISIHAPRVRSDFERLEVHLIKLDFNPRSPCEERRYLRVHLESTE